MKVLSATEARANFQEIIDKVHYTKEALILSKRGKPWVMVMPLKEEDDVLTDIVEKEEETAV